MLRLSYVENNNSYSMIKKVYQTAMLLMVAGLLLSLSSCNPSAKYEKAEKEAIADYLSKTTLDFVKQPSGLYYYESLAGTGVTPVEGDTAYVQYTGKFLDGSTFDTNVDKAAFPFPVGNGYVIAGLDEGITYMKVGGKSVLLIPSNLGYGSQGYYTIGGYTALLFEVELKKVVAGPAK
jgi:FKBP-type peptidyl-prolyl cis-trans isomerase FkpA